MSQRTYSTDSQQQYLTFRAMVAREENRNNHPTLKLDMTVQFSSCSEHNSSAYRQRVLNGNAYKTSGDVDCTQPHTSDRKLKEEHQAGITNGKFCEFPPTQNQLLHYDLYNQSQSSPPSNTQQNDLSQISKATSKAISKAYMNSTQKK